MAIDTDIRLKLLAEIQDMRRTIRRHMDDPGPNSDMIVRFLSRSVKLKEDTIRRINSAHASATTGAISQTGKAQDND